MRSDAFIHFVSGSRRVNIRLGVLLLIPKSPQIHRLRLCRGVKTPPNECSAYDIKQTDGEVLVLEFWEMQSTPSLSLLPGPLRYGVVASERVLSIGQKELF